MTIAKYLAILFSIVGIVATVLPAVAGQTFPLRIEDRTMELGLATDRETVVEALSSIFPDEDRSVFNETRIQYNYFAVEGEGPTTIALDFDPNGKLVGFIVDAYAKEQNPAAQELLQWLLNNVGEGKKSDLGRTWEYGGMTFEFIEIVEQGEDSMYSVNMTKTGYVAE